MPEMGYMILAVYLCAIPILFTLGEYVASVRAVIKRQADAQERIAAALEKANEEEQYWRQEDERKRYLNMGG